MGLGPRMALKRVSWMRNESIVLFPFLYIPEYIFRVEVVEYIDVIPRNVGGTRGTSTRGTEKLRYIESDRRNMRLYLDLILSYLCIEYINPRLPKTP